MSIQKGKVQTVLGLIDPSELGVTLCHEHLHISSEPLLLSPDPCSFHAANVDIPFSMENLGWIRQYPYYHRKNLVLTDVEDALIDELKYYKQNGGSALVENTVTGLQRNIHFQKKLSEETGIHIISGTGFYVDLTHSSETRNSSVEQLASKMENDVLIGVDGSDIKSGVIGELGCSWPLTDSEKKVLQAGATVQKSTGCPIIIHPGRNKAAPEEILRILLESGAKADQIVVSHLDRTILDKESLLEFAALGSYCEFDLFGIETSHYQQDEVTDMPSDAQRIQRIKWLLDAGYQDKVTIAHDIHTKHRLMKYGGHGFSHILQTIVPMMKTREVSQEDIDKILIHNPKTWLTFK